MGLSYAAHTQMALACLNPPGLKAMYLDCGGFSNAYQGGIRQGGAFELKQITWAYNLGLESEEVRRGSAPVGGFEGGGPQGLVCEHALEAWSHSHQSHSGLRELCLRAVGAR